MLSEKPTRIKDYAVFWPGYISPKLSFRNTQLKDFLNYLVEFVISEYLRSFLVIGGHCSGKTALIKIVVPFFLFKRSNWISAYLDDYLKTFFESMNKFFYNLNPKASLSVFSAYENIINFIPELKDKIIIIESGSIQIYFR